MMLKEQLLAAIAAMLVCMVATPCLRAQDPVFSQFFASPLYLNPAYAGVGEGMSFYLHHRNQWWGIPDAGFKTYTAGWCSREPLLGGGIGAIVSRDVAGPGIITTDQFQLQYAYNISGRKQNWSLHGGVQAGLGMKQLNSDKFVFSDQLDPVLGVQFPTSATRPQFGRATYWDFSAGLIGRFGMAAGSETADNEIGVAFNHLSRPDESLQRLGTRLPVRFTAHYLVTIPWLRFGSLKRYYVYFSPMIRYERQQDISITSFGTSIATSHLAFGLLYHNRLLPFDRRHTDAWTLMAGFQANGEDNPVRIGLSYDLNDSGLGTGSGGAFELSVSFTLTGARMLSESSGATPLKCYTFRNKAYFK